MVGIAANHGSLVVAPGELDFGVGGDRETERSPWTSWSSVSARPDAERIFPPVKVAPEENYVCTGCSGSTQLGWFEQSLAICKAMAFTKQDETGAQRDLLISHFNIVRTLSDQPERAAGHLAHAAAIHERLRRAGASHGDPQVARIGRLLAFIHRLRGRSRRASRWSTLNAREAAS